MKKPRQDTHKQNQQAEIPLSIRPTLLTLAIAQALAFQTANAATIEVTSNLDNGTDCTLREAVTTVNNQAAFGGCNVNGTLGSNDTITFAPNVSGNTITLSAGSQIPIAQSMSVNPDGNETTINANASRIFFSYTPGITIDLDHLVLQGGNYATGNGGAISLIDGISSNTLNLTNSRITGNTASGRGGGMYAYGWQVNLTDSIISNNNAGSGGGLHARNCSTLTLTNSIVSGNSADAGGGLYARLCNTINLTNSTVLGNTANVRSGGLVAQNSTVSLINSTVSDNSADFRGGGMEVFESTMSFTNSTVSGNTANDITGGLYLRRSAVSLINSTVLNNAAPIGPGVAINHDGSTIVSTLTLENSIIANSVGGGQDCEYTGGNPSGHVITIGPDNIVETNGCGGMPQTIDPGLLPLADNGGDTQTHALMPGSPAIDGGNNATCEATDQRGEARDDGACDIGAYEFNATLIPIARKDRKMGAFMNGGEQWYSFDSTESQKLSMQTNGFSGDTLLEFYTGSDPKQVNPQLNMDDDSGPDLFSNIKHNVTTGPHLIRVKGKTNVDPYWLRLMSDKDILSFNDTASHFANKEIRVMSSAGITGGCGTGVYCPTSPVTRAQMAIFMLKAILGGNHNSPAATGTVFNDVSTSSFGANFIEEFSTLGITSGCGGGKYCPDLAVTREQMAVFLLRAWYGSSYTPPAATPAEINQFSDIANSFAKDWIVQLTKENITGGCGGGKFCPTDTVTRGQMAAFIARTFDLDVEL